MSDGPNTVPKHSDDDLITTLQTSKLMRVTKTRIWWLRTHGRLKGTKVSGGVFHPHLFYWVYRRGDVLLLRKQMDKRMKETAIIKSLTSRRTKTDKCPMPKPLNHNRRKSNDNTTNDS